ncbi:MAG TPA: hypothetical protein VMU14_01055 [Acidimicrobiales bacterium]|nr:hypothetical protein [Acidimicrobiales bacterium]
MVNWSVNVAVAPAAKPALAHVATWKRIVPLLGLVTDQVPSGPLPPVAE